MVRRDIDNLEPVPSITRHSTGSKSAVDSLVSPIPVMLGQELFRFVDFDDWRDTAKYQFLRAGKSGIDTVCLDAENRVCRIGRQFMRARDEGRFPVRVFDIAG